MDNASPVIIRSARSPGELEVAAQLFTAYAQSLGLNLDFQDFTTEVRTLPGKYTPPEGEILLACDFEDKAVGCVAMRSLQVPGCCEMKRLYVLPAGRGLGIGKKLVDAILNQASCSGYREIRLDTLSTMHKAIQLYEKSGFERIEAYYKTPLENTVFLARHLPTSVV